MTRDTLFDLQPETKAQASKVAARVPKKVPPANGGEERKESRVKLEGVSWSTGK